ncbi:hypothetical protein [Sphingomonas aerolata]|uniref:hypothetical protein n=1 Tax=Sphingomonas aerolata TaxID=185951 RepID=UPI002FE24AC1
MILVTLLALAQAGVTPAAQPAATQVSSAPTEKSWSILNPPDCPVVKEGDKTITVCAPGTQSGPRLPLPDWGPPDRPVASNPNMTAIRALSLEGTPCAATQSGCQSGFGPPIAPSSPAPSRSPRAPSPKNPTRPAASPSTCQTPHPRPPRGRNHPVILTNVRTQSQAVPRPATRGPGSSPG